jgi:hypothetical protein
MPDIDIDERREALDAFAQAGATARVPATVPAAGVLAGGAGAGERVVGAQLVAVKRNEAEILQRLRVLAAAAGESWYYRWPVREKKTGKITWVEGPSIKCANDLSRTFGNCETETRVVDLGDSWLIYARFTDYETGYSLTRPFQQRKNQRTMGDDVDRQRDIAFQIGCSKSIRNVVVNALSTFADFAFDEARNSLVDKIGKDLPKWREKTTARLAELGIDVKRVEVVLGRVAADWLAPDVAQVFAVMKSIKDGFSTIDESFPPLAPPPSEAGAALDQFATADSGTPAPAETPSAAPGPGSTASDATAEGPNQPPSPGPSAATPDEGKML